MPVLADIYTNVRLYDKFEMYLTKCPDSVLIGRTCAQFERTQLFHYSDTPCTVSEGMCVSVAVNVSPIV